MDRCRPDRGIARQYTAVRKKATGPYFHPPDLPHRGAGRRLAASRFRAHGLAGFFSFSHGLRLADTMKRAMARQAEGESLAAATASGTAMS